MEAPISLHVLVVDDELLIRWAVTETLRMAGHEATEASDATGAREAVIGAVDQFDVILLDYHMPDSYDLTLLADLRRLSPTSAIVLITADAEALGTIKSAAFGLGACLVLAKPVDMDAVGHIVQAVSRAMRRDLAPVRLTCGDHACAIHADPSALVAHVVDFIADGLARGEQCWYVPARGGPSIDHPLRRRGLDVDAERRCGAFRVLAPGGPYLADGRFEAVRTTDAFGDAIEHARRDGFTGFRAAADMSWARGVPGAFDRLVAYEAGLKTMFATSRVTGLCLYPRNNMPLGVLNAALATHPVASVGGRFYANPFYEVAGPSSAVGDSHVVAAKLQLFGLS